MQYKHLNKKFVKDLKERVQELSLQDITKEEIYEHLWDLYIKTLKMKHIPYEYYFDATAYLIVLKSILAYKK